MTTRNLFKSSPVAKIAEANPLTFFDIGTRGGFDSGLWPVAFATQAIGFEPNPVAFQKLTVQSDSIWKNTRILPIAVSGENGFRTLNVPSEPEGASLLEPAILTGAARTKDQYFKIIETHQVQTETMDQILINFDLQTPDYLKIDIEGAELEVLQSSPRTLDHLLAIKVEVFFDTVRVGQPLASEVMAFLQSSGFMFMDFIAPSHWRTDGYVVHPLLDKTSTPYARGQLMQCDLFFLRRPSELSLKQKDRVTRRLKLALIAMSFGYFDFASEIFAEPEIEMACKNLGCPNPLTANSACSKKLGRIESKKAFRSQLRGLGPFIRRLPDLIFS